MSANRDVMQANLLAGRFVAGHPQPMPKDKFWPTLAFAVFIICLSAAIMLLIGYQVALHWRGALWCGFWLLTFGCFLAVRQAKR